MRACILAQCPYPTIIMISNIIHVATCYRLINLIYRFDKRLIFACEKSIVIIGQLCMPVDSIELG